MSKAPTDRSTGASAGVESTAGESDLLVDDALSVLVFGLSHLAAFPALALAWVASVPLSLVGLWQGPVRDLAILWVGVSPAVAFALFSGRSDGRDGGLPGTTLGTPLAAVGIATAVAVAGRATWPVVAVLWLAGFQLILRTLYVAESVESEGRWNRISRFTLVAVGLSTHALVGVDLDRIESAVGWSVRVPSGIGTVRPGATVPVAGQDVPTALVLAAVPVACSSLLLLGPVATGRIGVGALASVVGLSSAPSNDAGGRGARPETDAGGGGDGRRGEMVSPDEGGIRYASDLPGRAKQLIEDGNERLTAADEARSEGDHLTALGNYAAAFARYSDARDRIGPLDWERTHRNLDEMLGKPNTTGTLEHQSEQAFAEFREAIDGEVDRGDEAVDAGEYDEALEHYGEARDRCERVLAALDDVSADDLPVKGEVADLSERLDARVEAVETREALLSLADEFADAVADAEAAREAGEHRNAVDAYERARRACSEAVSQYETASREVADALDGAEDVDDESAWEERLAEVETALDETEAAVERSAAREALEEGDALAERAEALVADDAFEEALDELSAARDAYERAHERAAATDADDLVADTETALDGVASRREEVELQRLDVRIDDLVSAVDDAEGGDADGVGDAVAAFDEVLDDVDRVADEFGLDREAEVLRTEARRGRVRARLALARADVEAATETYRDGEYTAAREAFEATEETLADVADEADAHGLERERDEARALAEVCEENADRAARARMPTSEVPDLESPDDVRGTAGADEPVGASGSDPRPGGRAVGPAGWADVDVATPLSDAAFDDFDVVEQVGAGGDAVVYRATVAYDGRERPVALKTTALDGETVDLSVLESFSEEAEIWSRIDDHDNVASVLGYGTRPQPWIATEFLAGGSLDDRVGDLGREAAWSVVLDVADAVVHARNSGVGHRDLKPANVLLTDGDPPVAKVTDWGIADDELDESGQSGLTPRYAAPEQFPDAPGEPGVATDVYQLGVLAYEVLTGRHPADAADGSAPVTDPSPPSDVADLPPALDDVLLTATAGDPDERYDYPLYVRDALREVREG